MSTVKTKNDLHLRYLQIPLQKSVSLSLTKVQLGSPQWNKRFFKKSFTVLTPKNTDWDNYSWTSEPSEKFRNSVEKSQHSLKQKYLRLDPLEWLRKIVSLFPKQHSSVSRESFLACKWVPSFPIHAGHCQRDLLLSPHLE